MPKVRTREQHEEKEIIEVTGQNKDCKLCSLHKTSTIDDKHAVCLWGSGNKQATIMLIGEAPSKDEMIADTSNFGTSGRLLDKYLGLSKIGKNDVYISHAVKCLTPDSRAPKPKELNTCKSYLELEINSIKPKVIGLLGAVAFKSVLGIDGITKFRGKPFWSSKYNCWCVPTFHPAFLDRVKEVPDVSEKFLRDLQYIKQIAETGDTGQLGTTVNIVDTLEKFKDFKTKLLEATVVSVDTETSGNYLSGKIATIQFCWKAGEAWVLPLIYTPSTNAFWKKEDETEIMSFLKTWLEDSNTKKIGQNIKYDYQFFKLYGITLRGVVFDTMLGHYLLNENDRGGHGLDSLALKYTDMGNYTLELYNILGVSGDSEIDNSTYMRAPLKDLCVYGGKDVDCTFRVFCVLYRRIKEQNLSELLTKVMIPLSFVLADMELRGIKVDVEYFKTLSKEYEDKLQKIEAELRSFPDVKFLERKQGKPVNFNSSDQLRVLFFEILGLPVHKMTSTKKRKTAGEAKPSTDKTVLEKLRDEHPIPQLIEGYRKLSKVLSTYASPMPNLIMEDGRLHTSYQQHVTTTGRLSSSKPNLQNIPKKDPEIGKQIRNGFVPEKDFVFIEADYAQLEFRLLASVSGDETMIADISDANVDIHKKVASIAFGMPYDAVDKKTRDMAKTIVYSVVYGKTEDNLAKETGLSVEQVKAVFNVLFKRYPRMKAWMEKTAKNAEAGYDVVNWLGRRRRLAPAYTKARAIKNMRTREALKAEARRQAINSPIQGGGHDILSIASIRIDKKLRDLNLKSRMVMTIHDALVVETHESEIEQVGTLVKTEMERPIRGIRVPMVADMSIGTRLGEMKKYVATGENL